GAGDGRAEQGLGGRAQPASSTSLGAATFVGVRAVGPATAERTVVLQRPAAYSSAAAAATAAASTPATAAAPPAASEQPLPEPAFGPERERLLLRRALQRRSPTVRAGI